MANEKCACENLLCAACGASHFGRPPGSSVAPTKFLDSVLHELWTTRQDLAQLRNTLNEYGLFKNGMVPHQVDRELRHQTERIEALEAENARLRPQLVGAEPGKCLACYNKAERIAELEAALNGPERIYCEACQMWGTSLPGNYQCGNCDSRDVKAWVLAGVTPALKGDDK